jgi:hypothetical protein
MAGVQESSVERQQRAEFRTFAAGCLIFRKILDGDIPML